MRHFLENQGKRYRNPLSSSADEMKRIVNSLESSAARFPAQRLCLARHIALPIAPANTTSKANQRDALDDESLCEYRSPSGARDRWKRPYNVLQVTTVSLHLNLGDRPTAPGSYDLQSPLDHIPASALCSATGNIVGSLHPDSLNLLPPAGSKIELLVIARSFKLTAESIRLGIDVSEQDSKLLWVMHVVRVDDIAERRGVGQILESALKDAVGERAALKEVLLG